MAKTNEANTTEKKTTKRSRKNESQQERWDRLKDAIMEDYAPMQKEFTKGLTKNFDAKPFSWKDLKIGTIIPIPIKRKDEMAGQVVLSTSFEWATFDDLEPEIKKCLEDNGFDFTPETVGSLNVVLTNGYTMMIRWDATLDRDLQPDYQFLDADGNNVISPKFDGWLPNGSQDQSWLFWINAAYPGKSSKLNDKKRCMWIVTKTQTA